jgi:hypothetical protein
MQKCFFIGFPIFHVPAKPGSIVEVSPGFAQEEFDACADNAHWPNMSAS